MPCFDPLIAFPTDKLTEKGKPVYKFVSASQQAKFDKVAIQDGCRLIPCGRCAGCRMERAHRWADRAFLEMQDYRETYFVTLSYDDDHIPKSERVDENTGEYLVNYTLRKKDWQDFMKRLRKNTGQKLRFVSCGEYGSRTFRPHMHAIIFGLHLPVSDLTPFKPNDLGQMMYNSKILSRAWQDRGFVVVSPASYETIAYTCRYVLKKAYGKEKDFYDYLNIEPEFFLMSRRPGIGYTWYERNKEELFSQKCVYVGTDIGSMSIYPNRYFKQLFEVDRPDEYAIIKESSELAEKQRLKTLSGLSSLDYYEQLKAEERAFQERIRALPRKEF